MSLLFYIGRFVNVLFLPLLPIQKLSPILSVLLVSLIFTLVVVLLRKRFLEKEEIKNIKKEMDEVRENILKSKEKNEELIRRLMELNKTVLKQTTKVLIASLILGVICLSWVHYNYSGEFVKLPLPVHFLQNLNMIYFYLILTFVISVVLSKLLGVSL